MIKLSIIIPVFNVEKFICKCLESCLNQDIKQEEYEIIVVNDGTPDGSMEQVRAIQEEQIASVGTSNIRMVDRPNGGLSAARNTGLKEAKGEYVWFVDSDDWIEPNVCKMLLDKLYTDNLDILCFNLQLVFDNGMIEPYHISHPSGVKVYEGNEFICKVEMPPAAVCGIYRRQYLIENTFSFLVGVLHEDMEFTPRVYCKAKRIAYIDDAVYNYYQRQGSIMKSTQNAKRCKDLLKICDSLWDYTINNIEKGSDTYSCMMGKIAFCLSQSVFFYSKDAFSLAEYKIKPYYPVPISPSLSFTQKLKYRLLNTSIWFYLFIQRKGRV